MTATVIVTPSGHYKRLPRYRGGATVPYPGNRLGMQGLWNISTIGIAWLCRCDSAESLSSGTFKAWDGEGCRDQSAHIQE